MSEYLKHFEKIGELVPFILPALRGPDIPLTNIKYLLTSRFRYFMDIHHGAVNPTKIPTLTQIELAKAQWKDLADNVLAGQKINSDIAAFLARRIQFALSHWVNHCLMAIDVFHDLKYLEHDEHDLMRRLCSAIFNFTTHASENTNAEVLKAIENFCPKEKDDDS